MKALENNPSERPPAMAGLIIRALRASDIEAVTALINLPGFRFGTLRLPYQTIDETRKRFENAGPGQVNLVAELDDRIVGDAGMMRYLGRRSHAANTGMGVHDDFTGKGIGSALLAELIDMADNWLNKTTGTIGVHRQRGRDRPLQKIRLRRGGPAQGLRLPCRGVCRRLCDGAGAPLAALSHYQTLKGTFV
ncbi:GNAT superfamily N-acetyltransferase [Rhizobium mongolense]